MVTVEICCNSLHSARAALQGGAYRIELCANLECGGTTPDFLDIDACIHQLELRTHVLLRPRPGDFCYNRREIALMEQQLRILRRMEVPAVVMGFLDVHGFIDVPLTRHMVECADGMEVTFHRAFDVCCMDPIEALSAVAQTGCHRLLTSGQQLTALQGAETIARLVDANRMPILAGSGITPDNVCTIVALTGVGEVHASCKQQQPDGQTATSTHLVSTLINSLSEYC